MMAARLCPQVTVINRRYTVHRSREFCEEGFKESSESKVAELVMSLEWFLKERRMVWFQQAISNREPQRSWQCSQHADYLMLLKKQTGNCGV